MAVESVEGGITQEAKHVIEHPEILLDGATMRRLLLGLYERNVILRTTLDGVSGMAEISGKDSPSWAKSAQLCRQVLKDTQ